MDSISLKDFIAESLKAISTGVREAQDHSKSSDGVPIGLFSIGGAETKEGEQLVHFKVALQAEQNKSRSGSGQIGGALISVVTGKVGISANASHGHLNTHSLEFSVPIYFNSRWSKE